MSLAERLKRQIAMDGPMTVAAFMTACLHDPQDGYYATQPQLGAEGDFITAPMVSQIFGELIGLWLVDVWESMDRPSHVRLIEVGPGRGELISDALRAAAVTPDFLAASDLWLVEPSGPLRALQAQHLTPERLQGVRPQWASALDRVPSGQPILLIANEVLDCLPARQFVRTPEGWMERRIGVSDASELVFGLAPPPGGFTPPDFDSPLGAVFEVALAQDAFGAALGESISHCGGAALLIDYGRSEQGWGDTLQALRRHQRVSPLDKPGLSDLTIHADFPAVARAARLAGAETTPIVTQRAFLNGLGAAVRTEALKAKAIAKGRPDLADVVDRQLHRLVGEDQMGDLFKVVCIHSPGLVARGF